MRDAVAPCHASVVWSMCAVQTITRKPTTSNNQSTNTQGSNNSSDPVAFPPEPAGEHTALNSAEWRALEVRASRLRFAPR